MSVVKDRNGDASKCSNYRPGSLVTMFSKVLELYIFSSLESNLKVAELQFGFVPKKGCQKALFTLETVVNYFTDHSSPAYVASLNVSKPAIGFITLPYLLNS